MRLILRYGLIYGSGEDLILAAILQEEHGIDLREELEYFCKQSEKFEGVAGDKITDFEFKNESEVSGHVHYDGDDRTASND